MMTVLERDMVPLDLIRSTRIGKVLRIATKRDDFGSGGKYVSVGTNILKILQNWRRIANQYIQDMGL